MNLARWKALPGAVFRGVRKFAHTATIGLNGAEAAEEPGQISVFETRGCDQRRLRGDDRQGGRKRRLRGPHLVANCQAT